MAYFDATYYTNYFDVGAATAVVARTYGGDGPTREQWEAYLKKLNRAQKRQMAEKVADRQNLRKLILDQILPRETKQIIVRSPETRIEPLPKGTEPKYEVRQIRLPYIPDVPDLRRKLAQELRDIRRRARKIRDKRKLKKLREEEALILLLL